ncbi:hypothetical protein AX14_006637 [Amanita brunnescens Koide BX004]|nr:hypothetical protein AX14_006637 [Amanita brunnescens Koide BX004]
MCPHSPFRFITTTHPFPTCSGSMEPAFYRGDLLFLTAATLDQGRQPRNWRVALPRARMAQRVHSLAGDGAEQFVSVGAVATGTTTVCVCAACYFHHPRATRIPTRLISLGLETGSVFLSF